MLVLLKISLKFENKFYRNLGDFLAVSFVSCKRSVSGLLCWMIEYRHGMNVLMEAMFHATILASRFEKLVLWIIGGGCLVGGGGLW